MIDLGYTYDSGPMSPETDEPKKHYPEICIRGKDIPKLPDGEFYVVMKGRVSGMRKPAEGEQSIDIEMLDMSGPVDEKKAMKVAESSYTEEETEDVSEMFSEDKAKTALRSTLTEIIKESAIGQSG